MIYAGVYESENIKTGLAGEIVQFSNIDDKYADAVENYEVDCQLVVKFHSLANYLMLSNFKSTTRRVLLAAIYNSRKSPFNDSDDDESKQNRDYTEEEGSIFTSVVHLVYAETDPSDWSLRDIVVKQALELREFFQALNTASFQKLLRDIPDFAIDVASSKIGRVGKCKYCRRWVWARLTRCPCGKLIGCPDQECNNDRNKRSLCVRCARFNVVKFTPESQALGIDDSDLESDEDESAAETSPDEDEDDQGSNTASEGGSVTSHCRNDASNHDDEDSETEDDDYVEWLQQIPLRV